MALQLFATASVSPLQFECNFDLLSFLPHKENWLTFLKCLANDDVEQLKEFTNRVMWTDFLRSKDTQGVWTHCGPHFTRPNAGNTIPHMYPTNPFFVAMFYNAQKCLLLMKDSADVDFSRLTERGFNAYHMLMSAIHFIISSCHDDDREPDTWSLVTLFHNRLFTRDQLETMFRWKCQYGMAPISWGMYIGLAKQVDMILFYYSPDSIMKRDAVGLNEHIVFDISEYLPENPDFFVSPMSVLFDVYDKSCLGTLDIEHSLILKHWIEKIYGRAMLTAIVMMPSCTSLAIATGVHVGVRTTSYLQNQCINPNSAGTFPTEMVTILSSWMIVTLYCFFGVTSGTIRKEFYRHKFGYPRTPRHGYSYMLQWNMSLIVALPASSFLFWIYKYPEFSCYLFGSMISVVSGCCTLILLLASVALIVCYMRLIWPITVIMSSMYKSMGLFLIFSVLQFIFTALFTRMFQSSLVFTSALGQQANSTTAGGDSIANFFRSFYLTFLISLSIVDEDVFKPGIDRIDLSVTHFVYMLTVPILFVNFVVGILSSVVDAVVENDTEYRYWMMLATAEPTELLLYPASRLKRMLFGPGQSKISMCLPMGPDSRLVESSEFSLDDQPVTN